MSGLRPLNASRTAPVESFTFSGESERNQSSPRSTDLARSAVYLAPRSLMTSSATLVTNGANVFARRFAMIG